MTDTANVVVLHEGRTQATMFHVPHKLGARVCIDGKHGIEGVVTGFAVYPHMSEIRVDWFANGDAKSVWFADWRVTEADAK